MTKRPTKASGDSAIPEDSFSLYDDPEADADLSGTDSDAETEVERADPDPYHLPGGSSLDGLSFEDARDALAEVVQRLESGQTALDEALALWERGEQLANHCQEWLDGARRRITDVRRQYEGDPTA